MHCCIVKRNNTFSSYIPLILILVATVALAIFSAGFFIYIPFMVIAAGIILTVYLSPSFLKTEYEYNLEGDLFSIAIIRNKSTRKELFSCDITHLVSCTLLSEAEPISPTNKIDASSTENSLYYIVFSEEDKVAAITFSPSEDFVKELRLLAPRKVKCNILTVR